MRGLDESKRKKRIRKGIFLLLMLVILWNVLATRTEKGEKRFPLSEYFLLKMQESVLKTVFPFASYQIRERDGEMAEKIAGWQSPYIAYATANAPEEKWQEERYFYELLLEEQSQAKETAGTAVSQEETDLLAAMEAENAAAKQQEQKEEKEQVSGNDIEEEPGKPKEEVEALAQNSFQKVLEKRAPYDWSNFKDTESIIKEFYAVDSTTSAEAAGIDLQSFLKKDLTINKDTEGYQILIFHTHSQETFVDSVPGDASTTIVGAGDVLTKILTENYGYKVLHHTGEYDVEYRDDAYSKALPAIEQVLRDNPDIQVVIDLHRDEVAEGTKLVTEVQGRPTAKFMFFNGLSYTKQTGKIDYLVNDNLSSNLAFSFQMQVACNEYFPGITRRIYLKGYRYNMHLKERFLLVELGAQTNTVEEAQNACEPLAQMLDMVLSGMVY